MSLVHKCERCENVYSDMTGAMQLDVSVCDKADGHGTSWSDIDLCARCAKPILDLIAGTLGGFKWPRKSTPKRAAGGHARAEKLSPAARSAIASRAADARWEAFRSAARVRKS